MIKAIIFDMDGIIVDSEMIWRRTFREVLAEYGHEYTDKHFKLTLGKANVTEILKKTFDIKEDEEVLRKKILDKLFSLMEHDMKFVDGFYSLLNRIKEKYILAVASSSPIKIVESILERLKIRENFQFAIGGDQVQEGKPNPELFLKTAEQLGVKPEECIVIEDAPSGIKAAKSAGMRCIALKAHYVLEDELREAGADIIINNLDEITEKLLKGFS